MIGGLRLTFQHIRQVMWKVTMICMFSLVMVFPGLSQHRGKDQVKGRGFSIHPGINLNYPLHDDMIRSHRQGAGVSLLFAWPLSKKYDIGIRLGYDYHWPRRNFPDPYNGSDTSKLAFSVLSAQVASIFHFKRGWAAGLDLGYGLPDTKGKPGGLGWIQEYDGVARNYLASSIYAMKNITPEWEKPLLLSLVVMNLFGESHAENSMQLRLEIKL